MLNVSPVVLEQYKVCTKLSGSSAFTIFLRKIAPFFYSVRPFLVVGHSEPIFSPFIDSLIDDAVAYVI